MLVLTLLVPHAGYAAGLSAFLVPDQDRAEVSYIGVKTITLEYPAGSTLAQACRSCAEECRRMAR